MSGTALAFARAAEALVGSPFRVHGRDPVTGIDCIGLLQCALAGAGRPADLPLGYSLRTTRWDGLAQIASDLGFVPHDGPLSPGDICLFQPSPVQLHFAVVSASGQGLVEAHAGLRRVVIMPLPSPYPIVGQWRFSCDI